MFKTLQRKNTQSAKWDMAKNHTEKENYLVFSVADSDYETAQPIKKALEKRVHHAAYGYTLSNQEYLGIIKNWIKRHYGIKINENQLLLSQKVLGILSHIINVFTKEKDKIVIQTPVYHVFYPLIKTQKRILVENVLVNHQGHYSIDFDDLEKAFKTGAKLFLFCNPQNPVGKVWSYDDIKRIVSLCKAYDVYFISDEIHSDLIMPNNTFTSVGQFFDIYEKIIIVNAPSKTFNLAGLQSAYAFTKSKRLHNKLKTSLQKYFALGHNLMAIEAIKAAYTECDDWVENQNIHIQENYEYLKSFLSQYFKEAVLSPLEATYLTWIDFSYYEKDTDKLFKLMASKGVILAKGTDFQKNHHGFMRMNIACSKEQLKEGLTRIKDLFN